MIYKIFIYMYINNSKDIIMYLESSISYADSILVLSLVLPSRQEKCRFHLNLQTANVGQLIDEIKGEDAGIEHVHVYDDTGKLLSKAYSIGSLMKNSFTIQLNRQRTFLFDPIKNLKIKETTSRDKMTEGPSIEDTVSALHHALNVMQIYHTKYHELKTEANELTIQLEPLEKVIQKFRIKFLVFFIETYFVFLR